MILILKKFFIGVGGVALSTVSIFKNIKKPKKEEKTIAMFNELDVQSSTDKDFIERIRNLLLPHFTSKHTIIILTILFVILCALIAFEIGLMFLVIIVMTYVFLKYYPKIKEKNSYNDLNQELPYALRHMGIELKSGKGLHDCIMTIKNADYGSLSNEFTRVLEEIKFGKSMEDALLEMSHRVNSDGLTRTIHQIIGTLRVGGNVANSLDIIAKDISFEMQIKLKEYSQKLNSFILIYTFIAILAPVISLIMLMAGTTVMGDVISGNLLLVIYSLFFPMIVMFMGVFVKKLEPKI